MKILLLLLLMIFSTFAIASGDSKLYIKIKNDDICIYTNDPNSDYYDGRIYLYMGEVNTELAYQSSYSATYHHINIPKSFADCIAIKNSNFKHNIPYDINLDMNKAYSQRICVSKPNGKIQLMKVVDGYTCGREKHDYSGKNLFEKFITWIKSLLI
ncbi:NF045616 family extracytoplasmic (lipo)protein [Acinetobacter shaoyimingii]|uniref:Uncharacterized protein n=1 Tax=Acinetobacter shaoyimingii TaxID=2715164 RepID=A0A6G8RZW2_9GAMM|nr:NF045616 family extracytoplasmic (lipo)protein [Acinetobacter shaoyimingii]QIO07338.1 hypothetical protein G8E00_16020 [Acinetobacter shaoyimingii]